MKDGLHDEAYRELQREYLAELPASLNDLRKDVEAFRRGDDVAAALKTGFHRLAGSGGSYGFPEISEIARSAEHFVMTSPPPGKADVLDDALCRLQGALNVARAHLA